MKTRKNSEGFAMIEVLIAIVVLAIGLLAGSRMQILGLNYTQGAMTRSYVNMAANDILDRMRLNPEGIATYNTYTTANAPPADQGCATKVCNATEQANQDLRIWAEYFSQGNANGATTLLPPGAIGLITVAGPTDAQNAVIRITWNDFIGGAQSGTQSIDISAEL